MFASYVSLVVCVCVCVCAHALNHVQLFATPWIIAGQTSLSMKFSSKNAGVGCPFLLQGIFPSQGSNQHLLGRQEDSFTTESPRKPCFLG